MSAEPCPTCDAGMEAVSEHREASWGDQSAVVLDEFFRCPSCREEVYAPGQMQATMERVANAAPVGRVRRWVWLLGWRRPTSWNEGAA